MDACNQKFRLLTTKHKILMNIWSSYHTKKDGPFLLLISLTVTMIACMLQAPKSVRLLFREPCIRVSSEVSKVLLKLADSISKRRHFSHDILSIISMNHCKTLTQPSNHNHVFSLAPKMVVVRSPTKNSRSKLL
ncbi:hypothetical protein HPP92_001418 [Vanilla planifolia]|uniref:Uncharacterized protein n=1 Tax=Vanilla planifolia TaxID=51239 RepID=A0A835S7N6_VANPL|nr:hypothetical protein HPP92_001418 [Vanilla planifolia]